VHRDCERVTGDDLDFLAPIAAEQISRFLFCRFGPSRLFLTGIASSALSSSANHPRVRLERYTVAANMYFTYTVLSFSVWTTGSPHNPGILSLPQVYCHP